MTEAIQSTNETTNDNQVTVEEKLYAGKYRTIEDMEEAVKGSARVYQENQELKKQLESFSRAPDDYNTPSNLALNDNEVVDIKTLARQSGLTQTQFEKLVYETNTRKMTHKQQYEAMYKEIGEEKINVLKDYVSKHYPEKIADTVMEKLIKDKEAREIALNHRQKLLNSSVPGINTVTPMTYTVTYDDVLKAREAAQKQPGNIKQRDRYLNLMAQHAKQKRAG